LEQITTITRDLKELSCVHKEAVKASNSLASLLFAKNSEISELLNANSMFADNLNSQSNDLRAVSFEFWKAREKITALREQLEEAWGARASSEFKLEDSLAQCRSLQATLRESENHASNESRQ
jgi:hypothetical protein